ncbi:MAG: DUF2480 family protein [Rhodothermales bacterium]|nr:DUF2480 family protein [Rhodothermales bacterium]
MEPIVNRVAESEIELYDLALLWDGAEIAELDLEPFLAEGLILREKEFRQQMKAYDWAQHAGVHVAVFCSTDAIVPVWAYMLVASKLHGVARSVAFGRRADLLREHFARALAAEDWSRFADRIVVVKGCGSAIVPESAYVDAMQRLQGVARKLMYGEPCSSVPLWRRPPEASAASSAPRPAAVAKPALPPG